MRKQLIFSVITTLVALLSTNLVEAQVKRELKEQKRQEARVYEADQIREMLAKQDFFFQANQIAWTTHPQIQDIMLNTTTYGVWVYPDNLNVMLPIYGMNQVDVDPKLNEHLDFQTGRYKYTVTPNFDDTRFKIEINATNPWNLGQYTIVIMVDYEGRGTLTINSPLQSDAIFNGSIFAQ